jgi:micrococcal nuclease
VWNWIRGGAIAAAGLVAGLVLGFLVWGRDSFREGLRREYADGARVRVARVVDGDTIVLEDGLHVRYRGCDTPETFRFLRDPQPFAEKATARNRELVEGAWVRLRFPPAGMPAIDTHGRLLADVRPDAHDWAAQPTVAEALIRDGLAKVSSFELDAASRQRMRLAETEARDAARGIWAPPPPTAATAERFLASRKGRMVHREGCEYAKRIAPGNRMVFNTLEAGLQTGRRACPTCLPAGARK